MFASLICMKDTYLFTYQLSIMSQRTAKPTFEEVSLIYSQKFKPQQEMKTKKKEQSKMMMKSEKQSIEVSNLQLEDETLDNSVDLLDDKQFDRYEDFQDFTYDSNDFQGSSEEEEDNEEDEDFQVTQKSNNNVSKSQISKKRSKDRKIRTTITMQRLEEMNRIFKQYQDEKDKGRNPATNLKEIGQRLHLGYSTILHKFREFRQNKVVKGGALLQSLQKKRKYGKSKDVEKYIQKSLRERPFYTAVELSKYIFRRFKKIYSRSIISRHLTEMGYSFNNIKPFPIQKNASKYIETRKLFSKIIQAYVDEDANFIFIDEVAFSKNLFSRYFTNFIASAEEKKSSEKESDYVSLIIAANNQRIFYYSIKNGFFERDDFRFAIKQTADYLEKSKRFRMDNTKEYVLLTDTHKIHFDDEKSKLSKEKSINQTLRSVRMRRFFLPPGSPQLNPLESLFSTIRERLSKEKIFDQESLREKLSSLMEIIIKESTTVYFKELKIWMLKAKQGQNF